MKLSVIYDNHAFSFKAWNKCELIPVLKYIAVNVLFKVIHCKQYLVIESSDNVGSLFCLPVTAVDIGFSYRSIAVRSDGFSLKAAFIHINNGIALLYKTIKFTLINCSFYQAHFWVF